MYCRKYKETDDNIYNYLENLYENSSHKYINTVLKESDCFEIKRDLIKINEYTGFMEEFIQEVVVNLDDRTTKIKKLQELKTISMLNHQERNLYSMTYYKNHIEMNPKLSEEDSKQLLYLRFNQSIDRVIY